jgi:hypothetical protein
MPPELEGLHLAFGALFWAAMSAGLVLLVGSLVGVPATVWVAALVVLVVSAAGVLVLAFIVGRRQGESFGRALWTGISESFRWLIAFMP